MEILNEIIIYTTPFWGPYVVMGFFLGLIGILLFADLRRIGQTVILFLITLTCLSLMIYGATFGREKQTRYEVVFHDLININDFLDKYEIIGIEGHIVTIEEKE